jgi:Ca2+/Na+ antiporter
MNCLNASCELAGFLLFLFIHDVKISILRMLAHLFYVLLQVFFLFVNRNRHKKKFAVNRHG